MSLGIYLFLGGTLLDHHQRIPPRVPSRVPHHARQEPAYIPIPQPLPTAGNENGASGATFFATDVKDTVNDHES